MFLNLYGTSSTPQWLYGHGPDNAPSSQHDSCEGLRQGDALATAIFNILATRLYKKLITLLDGRGILVAIADDVHILAPPGVLAEVAEAFPRLAWEELGLRTQTAKSRIYVPPSAQEGWQEFLSSLPWTSLEAQGAGEGSLSFSALDIHTRR